MSINIKIPQISKQLYEQDVLNILIDQYSNIGSVWTMNQLEWMNGVYRTFNDHDKFLTIMYLTKKTLDFYSRNFTLLNYNQFYSNNSLEIEKFSISEITTNLNIPKESARRKIIELEKIGVIKRNKKLEYILIDEGKLNKKIKDNFLINQKYIALFVTDVFNLIKKSPLKI